MSKTYQIVMAGFIGLWVGLHQGHIWEGPLLTVIAASIISAIRAKS